MDAIRFNDDRKSVADREEIRRAVELLFESDTVVEIRALRTKRGTVSGYFDGQHRNELVDAAAEWSGQAESVYFTLNPVLPDLIARSANRMTPFARNTTGDSDIIKRSWLLLDFDPKRPSGISATANELEAALELARECRTFLQDQGWPEPIFARSGNGAHLLFRIDLPNDDGAKRLCKSVLKALAERFDRPGVTIDQSVFNASRICKLYGTLAAKGDDVPERPHRIATLVEVPQSLTVVSRDLLEKLLPPASSGSEISRKLNRFQLDARSAFNLAGWLGVFKVPISKEKNWQGGILYELSHCPWKPDAKDGGAFIAQMPEGDIVASCHHSSCQGKKWEDFRAFFEPGFKKNALEQDDDPHRLARLFLESNCNHPDGATLQFWRGIWHRWNGIIWRPIDVQELKSEVLRVIKAEFDRLGLLHSERARKAGLHVVNSVLLALQSLVQLSGEVDQPAWLQGRGNWPASEILVAPNGLIHFPSLADGSAVIVPLTPRLFTATALDYQLLPNAQAPEQWLNFLSQLWPDDHASIAALQEWMGYVLTPDTRYQKILMLVGPRRSGKSTIARVIQALVGHDNSVGPTMASLGAPFGLSSLIGKQLAVIADARLSGRTDSAVLVERLLSISGEDTLSIDRKYSTAWNGKLPTRIMIVSNELPRFADASGAIAGRMLVLRLQRSWYGQENPELYGLLIGELPGILLWAVQGWRRLNVRRSFIQPSSSQELVADLLELGSPVGAFLEARCELGPRFEVPRKELYEEFKQWCTSQGHTHIATSAVFGRDLRSVLPGLATRQSTISESKVRLYVGLRLRQEKS